MKNLCLALALSGAFAGTAAAQSSVAVYGLVDVGLVVESGGAAGSVTKLTSGAGNGSRLGFRGTEDLGGGLSANFVLESGLLLDTGGLAQGGLFLGRQSTVGLKGSFGAMVLGRQLTPYFSVLGLADPFSTGSAGAITNVMATTGTRMNNTVKYQTPNLRGFTGEIAYGLGEVAGNNSANRAFGYSAGYANGALDIRIGHHHRNNATGSDSARNTIAAGTYDFKVAKAYFAYAINKGAGALDSADAMGGVSIPLGVHKLMASYIRHRDKTAAGQDASQWALGYVYRLSKRTDIYTSYGRINNRNGASFTVGNATELGSGDKAFNVGVRHIF